MVKRHIIRVVKKKLKNRRGTKKGGNGLDESNIIDGEQENEDEDSKSDNVGCLVADNNSSSKKIRSGLGNKVIGSSKSNLRYRKKGKGSVS